MKSTMSILTYVLFLLFVIGCDATDKRDTPTTKILPEFKSINGTGELVPSQANSFTFAVFGDNQGAEKAEQISDTIFEEIANYQDPKPAFALSLGDIVRGKDPEDPSKYIEERFIKFLNRAAKAKVPIFNAPGNHELDDRDDIPSKKMHEIYQRVVGPSYGAFDYGNSRFISLNTEEIPPAGTKPPPEGIEFSYMSDTQLGLLDADLNANRDKKHIFIMMHYPMKPKYSHDALTAQSHKKMSDILAKYTNISFVLAAHEHIFYNALDPNNVTSIEIFTAGNPTQYLISGGAGADVYEPTIWAFHHYLIFEVDDDNISVTIHRVN